MKKKIEYKRYNFFTNQYENRTATVTFVKKWANGLVQTFITDDGDSTRNCIVYKNKKNLTIGADFI